MTYRELAAKISKFTANQLDADVTIYDRNTDEYFHANIVSFTNEKSCDYLDDKTPVIIMNENRIE